MTGKQITELDTTTSIDDGDLMLVRKSGAGEDKSITRAKFIESIGNSAVQGFNATSEEDNKITLQASNTALIPKYYEGMKISFISPISTNDIAQVQIGSLSYIDLQKYSLDETVQLLENEYVEAVYTNGTFKQTNNLNTHLVWSNEYTAKALINPEETVTTFNLVSAVGVKKTGYYTGMSLLFTVPQDSKGVVFVNVDGLGNKKLGESGGSLIAKDVYKDTAIMAIYDGTQFVKQKFSTIHIQPLVVDEPTVIPDDDIVDTPVVKSVDIWSEDYLGDPDDPANTNAPNALDSRSRPMFAKTITVGDSAMYETLPLAIAALINDYGADGGGHRFAIELDNSYAPIGVISIAGPKHTSDLRWITIFSKNNHTVNFNSACIKIGYKYAPIFNCKMSFDRTKSSTNPSYAFDMISGYSKSLTLTFGKNTVIKYLNEGSATFQYVGSECFFFVEAKYGIVFESDSRIFAGVNMDILINKGKFTFKFDRKEDTFFYLQTSSAKIYNTTFKLKGLILKRGLMCLTSAKAYLRNVKSTDRTGNISALYAYADSTATLENCDFSSKTNGEENAGYDIFSSKSSNVLHLNNTTGNTNIPVNEQTYYGIIHRK